MAKPLHMVHRSAGLTLCGALLKRVKVTGIEAEVTCGQCRRLLEASLPFNPMWHITHGEPFSNVAVQQHEAFFRLTNA